MATMASNHDQFAGDRLWNQLDGNLVQQRLAAATYLLLPGTPFIYYGEEIGMADAPTLKGDPKLRTPMSWTADRKTAGFTTSSEPFRELSANAATQNVAAELARSDGLRAHYKAVIALRKSRASLMHGSYLAPKAVKQTLSFQRQAGDDHTLVVFNYGRKPASVALADLPKGARLVPIWPVQVAAAGTSSAPGSIAVPGATRPSSGAGEAPHPATNDGLRADAAGKLAIEMAPQSLRVYDLKPAR
jgi:glycosidase